MAAAQSHRGERGRKGRVDQIIESVASGLGNSVTFMVEHGILFGVFALLWLAFGAALLLSQGTIDSAWQWIAAQHLVIQAALWILFLPIMAGLWIWETGWPLIVRLVLVAGLAGWSLLIFLPRTTGRG